MYMEPGIILPQFLHWLLMRRLFNNKVVNNSTMFQPSHNKSQSSKARSSNNRFINHLTKLSFQHLRHRFNKVIQKSLHYRNIANHKLPFIINNPTFHSTNLLLAGSKHTREDKDNSPINVTKAKNRIITITSVTSSVNQVSLVLVIYAG